MDDQGHFDDPSAVEDDHDALFGPAEEHATRETGDAGRIWRLHTTGPGYEGVSSAMTLEGAREFAAALRDEGITVLRLESVSGEVMDGRDSDSGRSDAAAQMAPRPVRS